MHIWLTIPSLSKRAGGPATVVQHLSEHLALSAASVSVLTAECPPGQSEALPRNPQINVVRVAASGRRNWRPDFGRRFQKALEQNLGSKNETVVHDFGLWLPANHAVVTVCRRVGVKQACSTCGMLSPWALGHKAWKKRLAWSLYQRRDIARASLIVATSQQEVQNIRRLAPGKNIALVPNGVEILAMPAIPRRGVGNRPRKVVFLGRLHPVKGLKNLVEAWNRVRPAGWHCTLAGPDEAGHQSELEALLRQRSLSSVFDFPGMMEDEQKWALLRESDLFVLPSFTENFGICVAEALACAVPVITTKGTPWQELVDRRCGWWVDIGPQALADALSQAMALPDGERREMGLRGRKLVEENYTWASISCRMLSVYNWILGRVTKPECVI